MSEKIPDGKRIAIGIVIICCLWALFAVLGQKEEITVYTSRASKQKYGDLVKAVENVRDSKVNVKTFDTLFEKTSRQQQIKSPARGARSDNNPTLESLLNGSDSHVVIDRLSSLDDQLPPELLKGLQKALFENKTSEVKKLFEELKEKTDSKKVLGEIAFQQCIIARDKFQYDEAFKYCQDALRFDSQNAIYLVANGDIVSKNYKYKEATWYYEQALPIFNLTHSYTSTYAAETKTYLAISLLLSGDFKKSIQNSEQALLSNIKKFGKKHQLVAQNYEWLGVGWFLSGNYKKAADFLEKSLRLSLDLFGNNNCKVGEIYFWYGKLNNVLGKYKRALNYYDCAMSIYKTSLPEKRKEFASLYRNIGLTLGNVGEYKKALVFFEQGLDIEKKYRGEHTMTAGLFYNSMALCYRKMNKPEKSINYLKKARIIASPLCGGNPCSALISINGNLGGAYAELGEYSMSIFYGERALSEAQEFFGQKHPAVASIYYNLSTTWVDLGDYKKAKDYCKKAMEILIATLGKEHPAYRRSAKFFGLFRQICG